MGVFKTLHTIHRKTTVSECLFNEPVATFFNKRLQNRCFLVDIAKLSRTSVLQESLKLLILCLWNISVTTTS